MTQILKNLHPYSHKIFIYFLDFPLIFSTFHLFFTIIEYTHIHPDVFQSHPQNHLPLLPRCCSVSPPPTRFSFSFTLYRVHLHLHSQSLFSDNCLWLENFLLHIRFLQEHTDWRLLIWLQLEMRIFIFFSFLLSTPRHLRCVAGKVSLKWVRGESPVFLPWCSLRQFSLFSERWRLVMLMAVTVTEALKI